MKQTQELMNQLAKIDPGDALVLSVYLDMRPHASGENPALRTASIVLKDRFREIEKTLLPRGPELDQFRIDSAKVQKFFDEHAAPWLEGVAIFASAPLQLFEVLETGVPFDDQVALEPYPDLFQLAHLIGEQQTSVIAVADTNTLRLFVTRRGFLEETGGLDEDSFRFRQRKAGSLNQKRYQRGIQNRRQEFAREAATTLEELVRHEGATRVLLAGDAVVIPLLHKALSPQLEPLIHEEVLRLDIRTPQHEVLDEVRPILAEIREEEAHSVADRLIEEVRAQGLGIIGLEETRDALTHGQVETLVLAQENMLPENVSSELVRLAALSSAGTETVQGHERLQAVGGVGGLLRYQASWV